MRTLRSPVTTPIRQPPIPVRLYSDGFASKLAWHAPFGVLPYFRAAFRSICDHQAIRDDEIDLDAGNDPDEWNVYLMSVPHKKKTNSLNHTFLGDDLTRTSEVNPVFSCS